MVRSVFSLVIAAAIAVEASAETCTFSKESGAAYLALEQSAVFACDLETAKAYAAQLEASNLSDCERKAFLRLAAFIEYISGNFEAAAAALFAYVDIAEPEALPALRKSLSLILDELGRVEEAEMQASLAGVEYPVTGVELPAWGCFDIALPDRQSSSGG